MGERVWEVQVFFWGDEMLVMIVVQYWDYIKTQQTVYFKMHKMMHFMLEFHLKT